MKQAAALLKTATEKFKGLNYEKSLGAHVARVRTAARYCRAPGKIANRLAPLKN